MKSLGTIFLGRKSLAADCLEKFHQQLAGQYKIRCIVTNLTPLVWWKNCRLADWARAHQIHLISNTHRYNNKIYQAIKQLDISLLISVQHNWILAPKIINSVNQGFNLHNAKLPEYQGFNAINHAILNQEKYYWSTIHWMTPAADLGPIAFEKKLTISKTETAQSLHQKAHQQALKVFDLLLSALKHHTPIPKKTVTKKGTFYKRNDINTYRKIKNPRDLKEIDIKARAFYNPPFEPAFLRINNLKYYVTPKLNKLKKS